MYHVRRIYMSTILWTIVNKVTKISNSIRKVCLQCGVCWSAGSKLGLPCFPGGGPQKTHQVSDLELNVGAQRGQSDQLFKQKLVIKSGHFNEKLVTLTSGRGQQNLNPTGGGCLCRQPPMVNLLSRMDKHNSVN